MIIYTEKHRFFSMDRIWFMKEAQKVESKSDLLRYMRCDEDRIYSKNALKNVDKTIINDLALDEENIKLCSTKTVKYEINRASNEPIQVYTFSSENLKIKPEILNKFKETYYSFCTILKNESLKHVYNESNIQNYIQANCCYITLAEFKNGSVYHLYVYDNKTAALIYSASDFRNQNVDKNLAGRANRFLHFKDMILFKQMGLLRYDWGNVTSFDNPNGIDRFKMSFGGENKIVYSYFVANTLKGKFLLKFRQIFGK